ncbi:hypothetical protein ACFQGT_11855 [Natrialbaceae archaeon GCM10025810]|uniref:hypothetical protein n=1 Tax=Halovalidus salilacus TaxID=3075124 RepID=UPI00361723A0
MTTHTVTIETGWGARVRVQTTSDTRTHHVSLFRTNDAGELELVGAGTFAEGGDHAATVRAIVCLEEEGYEIASDVKLE